MSSVPYLCLLSRIYAFCPVFMSSVLYLCPPFHIYVFRDVFMSSVPYLSLLSCICVFRPKFMSSVTYLCLLSRIYVFCFVNMFSVPYLCHQGSPGTPDIFEFQVLRALGFWAVLACQGMPEFFRMPARPGSGSIHGSKGVSQGFLGFLGCLRLWQPPGGLQVSLGLIGFQCPRASGPGSPKALGWGWPRASEALGPRGGPAPARHGPQIVRPGPGLGASQARVPGRPRVPPVSLQADPCTWWNPGP